jgi:hypothetical protein
LRYWCWPLRTVSRFASSRVSVSRVFRNSPSSTSGNRLIAALTDNSRALRSDESRAGYRNKLIGRRAITERLGLPVLLRSGSACGRITQLLIGFLAVCRVAGLRRIPGDTARRSQRTTHNGEDRRPTSVHSGTTQIPCFGPLRYKQFGLGRLWPPFSNR